MPPTCKNPHCQLEKTGACLEGIEQPSKCPSYLAAETAPADPAGKSDQPSVGSVDGIQLPRAEAMTPHGTYAVTRGAFARVIICAGEQRSGKTTLLASLYEAFQGGPLGALSFAGSRSLQAYERRVHLSRCASGLDRADTDRPKPVEGFQFLHLQIRDATCDRKTDLLFGDMSGELYKTLRDSSAECLKYDFIGRSHDFVLLLDGGKVALGEHAEAFAHVSALVRSLLDAGVLGKHSRVRLLTTKWDLLDMSANTAERNRIEEFEELFRRSFAPRLFAVECDRSAARPDSGATPVGIESLLRAWLATPQLVDRRAETNVEEIPIRSFDSYARIRRSASPWRDSW